MKDMNELRKYVTNYKYNLNKHGTFVIPFNDKDCFVVASNKFGWEHVSMHMEGDNGYIKRTPNNEEMQFLRNLFFYENDIVVEFHPKKEDYINNHGYVLHLWGYNSFNIKLPDKSVLTNPGKIITVSKNKFLNIRRSEDPTYERVNVRTLNKKKHITKRYPTWEEMCLVKNEIFGEDVVCIQFRFHDMNDDYSVDLYRPKEEIVTPPSILVGHKCFGKLV